MITDEVLASRGHDSNIRACHGMTQFPGAEAAGEGNNSHDGVCTGVTDPGLDIKILLEGVAGAHGASLSPGEDGASGSSKGEHDDL